MDDLISRKALLAEYDRVHIGPPGGARKLIEDAPAAQEWISVKDRLPEEEGLYLVAVVNDHERRYSKTAWYHGHGNWFLHQKVTHWQYLPQPPKGE